jgi:DNA-binding CsgD family transcriptional regulator
MTVPRSAADANDNQTGDPPAEGDGLEIATGRQRMMLAEFCRTLHDPQSKVARAEKITPAAPSPDPGGPPMPKMAPRLRQTLDLLLIGDGEKQIAAKLKLSPHTIHDYVKMVYRQFGVCSRAELLALWVRK